MFSGMAGPKVKVQPILPGQFLWDACVPSCSSVLTLAGPTHTAAKAKDTVLSQGQGVCFLLIGPTKAWDGEPLSWNVTEPLLKMGALSFRHGWVQNV